jgi:D-glycero-alpha-D-manno-heptose-7-phosphate kinase
MIISQTPFRISFAGGGTDLPEFVQREGHGAVVSVTIDKYIYIAIHRSFESRHQLKYSRTETCEHIEDIKHPLIRECLRTVGTTDYLEITSFADIPSEGSGLGSSSAFTVGLLHALHAQRGRVPSREICAAEACAIEIDRLGEPIGRQDQYAAAYGGMNFLRFLPDGAVEVEPIVTPREVREGLESRLLLFYTGVTRRASDILSEQSRNFASDATRRAEARSMREQAESLRRALVGGDYSTVGYCLDEGWRRKRRLATGISDARFDALYERAVAAGATGGKILGAGGGGFFLFYAEPEKQPSLRAALADLREVPIRFERQGTRLIYVGDNP